MALMLMLLVLQRCFSVVGTARGRHHRRPRRRCRRVMRKWLLMGHNSLALQMLVPVSRRGQRIITALNQPGLIAVIVVTDAILVVVATVVIVVNAGLLPATSGVRRPRHRNHRAIWHGASCL